MKNDSLRLENANAILKFQCKLSNFLLIVLGNNKKYDWKFVDVRGEMQRAQYLEFLGAQRAGISEEG